MAGLFGGLAQLGEDTSRIGRQTADQASFDAQLALLTGGALDYGQGREPSDEPPPFPNFDGQPLPGSRLRTFPTGREVSGGLPPLPGTQGRPLGRNVPSFQNFTGFGGGGGAGVPNFEETARAREQLVSEIQRALGGQLGFGSGQFGQVGGVVGDLLRDPSVIGGENLRLAQGRIAEREAGIRQAQQRRLQGGQGGGQVSDAARELLSEQLRGQSAGRIASQELDLALQADQLASQNRQSAIQAALQAAGISAGQSSTLAQLLGQLGLPLRGGGGAGSPGGTSAPRPGSVTAGGIAGSRGGTGGQGFVAPRFGDPRARLPGESLADQIRREAAARAAGVRVE